MFIYENYHVKKINGEIDEYNTLNEAIVGVQLDNIIEPVTIEKVITTRQVIGFFNVNPELDLKTNVDVTELKKQKREFTPINKRKANYK